MCTEEIKRASSLNPSLFFLESFCFNILMMKWNGMLVLYSILKVQPNLPPDEKQREHRKEYLLGA